MEVSQLLVKKIANKESHKNRREKIWNKEKVVFPIFFNRSASRVCPSLCFCLFCFDWGFVLFCFVFIGFFCFVLFFALCAHLERERDCRSGIQASVSL